MNLEYFHIHNIFIELIEVATTINFSAYVEKDIFELLVSKVNGLVLNYSYSNFQVLKDMIELALCLPGEIEFLKHLLKLKCVINLQVVKSF